MSKFVAAIVAALVVALMGLSAPSAATADSVAACSTAKKTDGAYVTRIEWASGRIVQRRNLGVRTKLIPGTRKLVSKRPGKRIPTIIGCKAAPGRVVVRTPSRRYAFVTADVNAVPTIDPTTEPTSVPTTEPTAEPTMEPTTEPSVEPTVEPTTEPSETPPAVSLPGATAAAIGDSNTARNGPWGNAGQSYIPQSAWFHHASVRVGQRVRLANNFAVSGTRSDQMLAQQVPQVLALTQEPAVVTVMAGTNDINQGRSAEEVIASLDEAYSRLAAADIPVIAGTVLPSTYWGEEKLAAVRVVNDWIRARGGIVVADFNRLLSDECGAPLPDVLMDGIHVSPKGAAMMGRELAPLLERMFPNVGVLPSDEANLVHEDSVVRRSDGLDVDVTSGYRAGDRVVAIVEFRTDPGADAATRQIEARLTARGTDQTTGVFSDSDGWDGPEVPLAAVPRSGVLMSLPMTVPADTSWLTLSVQVTGASSAVHVDQVAIVRVD